MLRKGKWPLGLSSAIENDIFRSYDTPITTFLNQPMMFAVSRATREYYGYHQTKFPELARFLNLDLGKIRVDKETGMMEHPDMPKDDTPRLEPLLLDERHLWSEFITDKTMYSGTPHRFYYRTRDAVKRWLAGEAGTTRSCMKIMLNETLAMIKVTFSIELACKILINHPKDKPLDPDWIKGKRKKEKMTTETLLNSLRLLNPVLDGEPNAEVDIFEFTVSRYPSKAGGSCLRY